MPHAVRGHKQPRRALDLLYTNVTIALFLTPEIYFRFSMSERNTVMTVKGPGRDSSTARLQGKGTLSPVGTTGQAKGEGSNLGKLIPAFHH